MPAVQTGWQRWR